MEFIQSNFPWLAGISAAITMGWGYVKQTIFNIRNVIIRTVDLDFNTGYSHISPHSVFLRSRGYFKKIYKLDTKIVIESKYLKGVKHKFSLSSPKFYMGICSNNSPVIVEYKDGSLLFTFIRGTFNISELIEQLEEYSTQYEKASESGDRFGIYDRYGKLNEKVTINSGNKNEAPTLAKSAGTSIEGVNSLIKDHGFFITGKKLMTIS